MPNSQDQCLGYLCVKDILSTDEGRTLQETRFEYDQEGLLSNQVTTIFMTMGNRAEPIPVRETKRDAYDIVVQETMFGADGRVYRFPHQVLYERGEDDKVQRVTVLKENGGAVFFIGRHGEVPHRRGYPERVCHFTRDGDLLREHRYEYDSHGHQVRVYVRAGWHGEFALERRREFQYDEHGRAIHLTQMKKGEPEKQFVINRYYDDGGLCTYAVFMEDPDTVQDQDKLIPGFFHDYEYQKFPMLSPEAE